MNKCNGDKCVCNPDLGLHEIECCCCEAEIDCPCTEYREVECGGCAPPVIVEDKK